MVTFSLCMIVKNEEAVLDRCLSSFEGLFDEIIIVDTGSSDRTKEIAAKYTNKIYDYCWIDDFAAARNFAFSKATCDYIYSCDADEVLDEENYAQFEALKEAMLPEIEIVQMHYAEWSTTVLNAKSEYRAKLFKRLRKFMWQDPVHETVRTEPVVFDSDITILHMPQGEHANRDFAIFRKAYKNGTKFSKNLYHMYATELYKCGADEDFIQAAPVFCERLQMELDTDARMESGCVVAHANRVQGDEKAFLEKALSLVAEGGCAEICYELGVYYLDRDENEEAARWFLRALYETQPVVDIKKSGDETMRALVEAYRRMGAMDEMREYTDLAERWQLPDGN